MYDIILATLYRAEYIRMEVMDIHADGRLDRSRFLKIVTEMILDHADLELIDIMLMAVKERKREIGYTHVNMQNTKTDEGQ